MLYARSEHINLYIIILLLINHVVFIIAKTNLKQLLESLKRGESLLPNLLANRRIARLKYDCGHGLFRYLKWRTLNPKTNTTCISTLKGDILEFSHIYEEVYGKTILKIEKIRVNETHYQLHEGIEWCYGKCSRCEVNLNGTTIQHCSVFVYDRLQGWNGFTWGHDFFYINKAELFRHISKQTSNSTTSNLPHKDFPLSTIASDLHHTTTQAAKMSSSTTQPVILPTVPA